MLVNEGPYTLVATLGSWKSAGLLDVVAERKMFIQGPSHASDQAFPAWRSWASSVGTQHRFDVLPSPRVNIAFSANVHLADNCTAPWLLFMEEDFMISNQISAEAMRVQLQAAKNMLESGKAQGVRLRHIKDSGEPNYAMRKFAADHIFGDELRTEISAVLEDDSSYPRVCSKPFNRFPCPDCYVSHYLGAFGKDPTRFAPPCEVWRCDAAHRAFGPSTAALATSMPPPDPVAMYCVRTAAHDELYPATSANMAPRYTPFTNNPVLWPGRWYAKLIREIARRTTFKTFEQSVQESVPWSSEPGFVMAIPKGIFRHQRWDRGRDWWNETDPEGYKRAGSPDWSMTYRENLRRHDNASVKSCEVLPQRTTESGAELGLSTGTTVSVPASGDNQKLQPPDLRRCRIALYVDRLGERGTTLSTFQYGDYLERIYGLHITIIYVENSTGSKRFFNVPEVVSMFEKRFGRAHVIAIELPNSSHFSNNVDPILAREHVDALYLIKSGPASDNKLSALPGVRNLVHAVFNASTPHGDVYARVSEAVPTADGVHVPVVPHMIEQAPYTTKGLRAELGIPRNATVFGRHGGFDTFDIQHARAAVCQVAHREPGIYFLFLNTRPMPCAPRANIIYLSATSNTTYKYRFIRTCDAMLHARAMGETFGIAIGEFSVHNLPVLTSSVVVEGGADNHLRILGKRGLYYHTRSSLVEQLTNFDRAKAQTGNWNAYSAYGPVHVMQTFVTVFLQHLDLPCSQSTVSALILGQNRSRANYSSP